MRMRLVNSVWSTKEEHGQRFCAQSGLGAEVLASLYMYSVGAKLPKRNALVGIPTSRSRSNLHYSLTSGGAFFVRMLHRPCDNLAKTFNIRLTHFLIYLCLTEMCRTRSKRVLGRSIFQVHPMGIRVSKASICSAFRGGGSWFSSVCLFNCVRSQYVLREGFTAMRRNLCARQTSAAMTCC